MKKGENELIKFRLSCGLVKRRKRFVHACAVCTKILQHGKFA